MDTEELLNEVDDVILEIEQEPPDENYAQEVDEWVASFPAEFDELQAQLHLVAAPPPMIPEEPLLTDWEYMCTMLDQFFLMRVYDKSQTMNWSLNEQLPRRGKDMKFDKFLQDLGIFSN